MDGGELGSGTGRSDDAPSAPALAGAGPRRGRPRDPGKDSAIREASLELLAEAGYTGLTMDRVARVARVSKASLYLRYPNKAALVADLLGQLASIVPAAPDLGNLPDDMRGFLRSLPGMGLDIGRALTAVVGEIATNPTLRTAWEQGLAGALTGRFRTIIARATMRGELHTDSDLDLLARLWLSLVQTWWQEQGDDPDGELIERIVDQFMDRRSAASIGGESFPVGPRTGQPGAGATTSGQRRGRRRGELTIEGIARMAGVSAPTVSKVLNGRPGVAPETRRRVEELLSRHDYRRPETVLSSACVEVAFFGIHNDLALGILRGVEQVACEYRLAVGFVDAPRQAANGRSWTNDLLARRPTGIIAVYSGFTTEQHALLGSSGIPLVAVEPVSQPPDAVPSVGPTSWSGAISPTRHLLELGHRRIGVITGPTEYLMARARLEGIRATLDAAGVPLAPELVRTGRFLFEDGLRLGRDLLGMPDRPTAVLCGSDWQALGVYEAARQAGLTIPHDLSVVGFDDIPGTRFCGPPMTTVHQPVVEMGAAATRLVLALAAGETLSQTRVELATTLVVRDSTAPPPEL